MSTLMLYVSQTLDREAQFRSDSQVIAERLAHPELIVLPVWRGHHLRPGHPLASHAATLAVAADLIARHDRQRLLDHAGYTAYLGRLGDRPVAVADLSPLEEHDLARIAPDGWTPTALRGIAAVIDREEAALLAYGQALSWWRARNRFCGVCGHPTAAVDGGHVIRCGSADCDAVVFPRTDPAIIVLVHDDDRILLGRPAQWPRGLHSVIAGFVEPGESIEGAVRREVAEETGVMVGAVEYRHSQPWPFPQSLMLGFRARAQSDRISLNDRELEHAGWYDRRTLLAVDRHADPAAVDFALPRADSIARRLIEDWLAEG